jgi:predicted glycoside hydrolase/deacetylase ChbG (UPF0249 family)
MGQRYLVVTADDYGIGPGTSDGIRDLCVGGAVTCALFLVNAPHAADALRRWRRAGPPADLGWHPCLTLDAPVLEPARVPSLVGADGRFLPLGRFLRRWALGRIRPEEVRDEWLAQYRRYRELVGQPPPAVATHHHVQVFAPLGRILLDILDQQRPLPYVRRVREPWRTLRAVGGSRLKRLVLARLGRADARQQRRMRVPGNQWLIGVTDPPHVADPEFFTRWLRAVVELICHPGHPDPTLAGRDDGQEARHVQEQRLLQDPAFLDACRAAGFAVVTPSEIVRLAMGGHAHAA